MEKDQKYSEEYLQDTMKINKTPYFEVIYRDDANIKHLINVETTQDINFLQERFQLEKCEYKR